MCEALLVIYDDNEFLNTFPLIKSREVNVFFHIPILLPSFFLLSLTAINRLI